METAAELRSRELFRAEDPLVLFEEWMAEAAVSEISDPNAMALATVDADGMPDVRIVLLKGLDPRGFTFFTNLQSAKGEELAANPKAALVFHWKSLERQVRIRGPVEAVSADEADSYFATRPQLSRIGAWASRQSRELGSREEFETEIARYSEKFADGDIPRPPHWSGFRVLPLTMEFWHNRPFRLHDRLVFRRESLEGPFTRQRLFP